MRISDWRSDVCSSDLPACRYYEARDPLSPDKLSLLRSIGEQPRYTGFVAKFFSEENRLCGEMNGKFVDGGSHAFQNEPARGERRWFIPDVGRAELTRAAQAIEAGTVETARLDGEATTARPERWAHTQRSDEHTSELQSLMRPA